MFRLGDRTRGIHEKGKRNNYISTRKAFYKCREANTVILILNVLFSVMISALFCFFKSLQAVVWNAVLL